MPLFAGVCETNITPPIGTQMTGYGWVPQTCLSIHDELFARALVIDDGFTRLVLITADLLGLPETMVKMIRQTVSEELETDASSVMICCSHTHGGPHTGVSAIGTLDPFIKTLIIRKLTGAAKQASLSLVPVHLTYGESSAQIGVNRRKTLPAGRTVLGLNYAGVVAPIVQTLLVNGANGKTLAMLFSHACHPTTLEAENRSVTADWPGAAVAALKRRFQKEGAENGIEQHAVPFFLQGCCGDINPVRKGSWEAMEENGEQVAEAAHAARWSAHGRLEEVLSAEEITISLPTLSDEPSVAPTDCPFTIQLLSLGGVSLIGFPAEMFVRYQNDFRAMSVAPLFLISCSNGCLGYMPTADEYARGGYEIEEAHRYYGKPRFAPECEEIVRRGVEGLLLI